MPVSVIYNKAHYALYTLQFSCIVGPCQYVQGYMVLPTPQ